MMPHQTINSPKNPGFGFNTFGGGKKQQRIGWCHFPNDDGNNHAIPAYLKSIKPHSLALFGQDRYVAIAHNKEIVVLLFKELSEQSESGGSGKLKPFITHKLPAQITALAARGSRKPNEILTVLKNGSTWSLRFDFSKKNEIKVKQLAERCKDRIKAVISTRSRILLWGQSSSNEKHILLEVDPRSTRIVRRVELPFSNPRSITPVNADKADSMVVIDGNREARLLTLPAETEALIPVVTDFNTERVSSATMLNYQYLVLAQKGGQISKVNVAAAGVNVPASSREVLARACKLFCWLQRICKCHPDCSCKDPEQERPEVPGGGGIVDDEPCDERQTAKLQWTPQYLFTNGGNIVAFSTGNQRMAVLDQNLNLVFERYVGKQGAVVATGLTSTDHMLLYQPRKATLEAWSLNAYKEYVLGIVPSDVIPRFPIAPSPAPSMTYYGQRRTNPLPNPNLKVAVFTVVEPGQPYTDPDQGKLLAQMEPMVFDIVTDYYDECSYGELEVQFSVFGANIGDTRTPLVLPQPAAAYFYDAFTSGGVEAVMPADWANPLVLDGTESLTIRSNPRIGDSREYQIPFASLWTKETFASYPVEINFDDTETMVLSVEDQEGNTHTLNLTFGAFSVTHNQGDDETAFLQSIGNHVTAAIRAAEAALPGDPVTIQDVIFRRIRTSDDDTEFGILQGQFRIAPPADPGDATQKGRITINTVPTPIPDGIAALGLDGPLSVDGELASGVQTGSFFMECLNAAQFDAGEGFGLNDPHFNTVVRTDEDSVAMEITVRINLTSSVGGAGATLEVISHSGLNDSGWDASTPVPGSESNANNQNTLRYSQQLADDVFTAALDHIRATTAWNADAVRAMFEDFDVMMIGFVGAPPASLPAGQQWGTTNPADFGRLRMFRRSVVATDQNNPEEPPVTMPTNVVIGQQFSSFLRGLMAHELGHAIGLPDLYFARGYRDDLLYIGSWGMMGGDTENLNHFCGWSKWIQGWISEDSDEDLTQILDVSLPEPTGTLTVEAWLVPVEYWDNNIKDDVRSVVGVSLPIVQLMKVELGSDGGIINLIELRAPGNTYSQNLPPNPSVIVTNVLQPGTDRRWAVNGLYRRNVHRINDGDELRNTGDKWDFAGGKEFPVKGTTAEIMDTQTIRGGSIPVYRVKVEREKADYIDLYFQDNVPSWRSPDLWIDWPGDNIDPALHRVYPEGTPTDQGETVRFPGSGMEPHFMVARVHNGGTVRAEDVKVRWFICDPPGSGDDGRWVIKDTKTIPEIGAGNWETIAFTWNVDSSTSVHQCLRAEIIDWTIPAEVDPATGDTLHLASDDVILQNNAAQQNVFDFEALAASPYDLIEFQFQVHNDSVEPEIAALVPDYLPWGATLEVSPAEAKINPGQNFIFHCKLSLDDTIIRPGCNNDQGFLLTAWRRAQDSDEKWGSCFYFVRPRYKTQVRILRGYWKGYEVVINGEWKLVTEETVDLSGEPSRFVRVRALIEDFNGNIKTVWRNVAVQSNGLFTLDFTQLEVDQPKKAIVQAWFDRTNILGSSVSNVFEINYPIII
jgi:hypothetical protein